VTDIPQWVLIVIAAVALFGCVACVVLAAKDRY
jgi:hypothetical protein